MTRRASPRRVAFYVAVLLTLGLAGLFGGMVVLMNLIPGFMGMTHFAEEHHRVHDVTFAMLNGVTVVGMIAQLRAPARNAAAQIMALIPFAALLLAVAVTDRSVLSPPWLLVGAATVFATMFHPIGDPLVAFRGARPDRAMLALVAVAAVPLLSYAWTNVLLQRAGPNEHAVQGHYGFMAACSLAVIATGLLASARPEGWRIPAWVAGALPVVLGLTSLRYGAVDSALPVEWSIAAIGWGIAFIAAAEFRARGRSRSSG